ncbi:Wadjet anti-phage system protein JetD domain-containing protein [Dactylosporangium sp. CS-047395]|uniref:Wadjet anti-phage system protein JetD domain-containing protein n=1 Tax=Dactylosporangium sp. CS-047395 TaxID=3239936 RepID=UPI003D9129F8
MSDPMTHHTLGGPLTPRAARLAAELEAWDRRTITLMELWPLFARADPASATRSTRRADLAATIAALADAGMVVVSKQFDRTAVPPLPAKLTLPAVAITVTAAALAKAVPWRPELAWAASARLTVGQVGVLQTVNGWLRDRGRDTDVLPLRERSLELFGYEKRLDALICTSLFGPDRLTLRMLRTFRARPPLPVRRVGDGPILLVVENADTFDSLRQGLTATSTAVGHIAWGAGAAFEASVLGIGELDGVHDVAYFGDFDADGLRIPASAAATAAIEGLPAIRPARGLYRLLFERGITQPGQAPLSEPRAAELAAWLGEHAAVARRLLASAVRIPQESVNAAMLVDTAEIWSADL